MAGGVPAACGNPLGAAHCAKEVPKINHFRLWFFSQHKLPSPKKGYTSYTVPLDRDFEQPNSTAMLVPTPNTRARCTGDYGSVPRPVSKLLTYLDQETRPVGAGGCTARSRRHVNRRACSPPPSVLITSADVSLPQLARFSDHLISHSHPHSPSHWPDREIRPRLSE